MCEYIKTKLVTKKVCEVIVAPAADISKDYYRMPVVCSNALGKQVCGVTNDLDTCPTGELKNEQKMPILFRPTRDLVTGEVTMHNNDGKTNYGECQPSKVQTANEKVGMGTFSSGWKRADTGEILVVSKATVPCRNVNFVNPTNLKPGENYMRFAPGNPKNETCSATSATFGTSRDILYTPSLPDAKGEVLMMSTNACSGQITSPLKANNGDTTERWLRENTCPKELTTIDTIIKPATTAISNVFSGLSSISFW